MNDILSTNNVVWQKEQLTYKQITEPLDIIQVGDPRRDYFYTFLADWGQRARGYFCNAKKFMIFFHDSVPKIDWWNVGSKVELKKIKTFSLKVLLKICFHDKKTMLPFLEIHWLLLCTQELKLCPNLVEGTTNSIDHSYLHLSHWNWLGKMN